MPPGHPECPERLRAIAKVLAGEEFDALQRIEATPCDEATFLFAHPEPYIEGQFPTRGWH